MRLNKIKNSDYYKRIRSIYHRSRSNFYTGLNRVFGDKKYQKYIVIASARTGSNLLRSYLNSHHEVISEGEIFGVLQGNSCATVWNKFFSYKSKKIK